MLAARAAAPAAKVMRVLFKFALLHRLEWE
jgi:hypothetical protein